MIATGVPLNLQGAPTLGTSSWGHLNWDSFDLQIVISPAQAHEHIKTHHHVKQGST